MRYTDFRNIKRGMFVLILAGISLWYMQLVAIENWGKYVHFQFRISRSMLPGGRINGPRKQTAQDRKLIYFEYNDNDLAKKQEDYDNPTDAEKVADDNDNGKHSQNELTSDRGKAEILHNQPSNRFETINLKRFILNETNFTAKPLMVLFSSWVTSREKAKVHAVLRRLWNAWPSITPVVLTKDLDVQNECTNAGWDAQTLTGSDDMCYGPPILSTMFTDVIKKHDAYFYGYSNADIIFGDGLEKTMKFLYYYYSPWKIKPVLVVGRRHNVDFIKFENFTLNTPYNVRQLTQNGQLVIRSTDYFFTNRHFPWGKAPRVTIGRPYVVRAIIGWALQRGFNVIDATNTIESVHLTTEDGVFASWHKKGVMCNKRVLAALRWSIPLAIGHCECARLETFYGPNDTISLRHRPPNKELCGK